MERRWIKAKKEGNSWFAKCPFCGVMNEMVEDGEIIVAVDPCKHLVLDYDWNRNGELEMFFEESDE